jgi:hypothetical protein
MEQPPLQNVNNWLNTNIYSYLETSGGQSSNLYLNVIQFFTPVSTRHQWQLKTVVFLHWCLIRAVPFCLSWTYLVLSKNLGSVLECIDITVFFSLSFLKKEKKIGMTRRHENRLRGRSIIISIIFLKYYQRNGFDEREIFLRGKRTIF